MFITSLNPRPSSKSTFVCACEARDLERALRFPPHTHSMSGLACRSCLNGSEAERPPSYLSRCHLACHGCARSDPPIGSLARLSQPLARELSCVSAREPQCPSPPHPKKDRTSPYPQVGAASTKCVPDNLLLVLQD